jgi:hypothetical protein
MYGHNVIHLRHIVVHILSGIKLFLLPIGVENLVIVHIPIASLSIHLAGASQNRLSDTFPETYIRGISSGIYQKICLFELSGILEDLVAETNRGKLRVSYLLCLKLDFRNNLGNKRRQGERMAASQPEDR